MRTNAHTLSADLTSDLPATSAPASTALPTDEAAVRALFGQLLAAWGRGDGPAYGALFTEDADYIAFDGSRTRGRQEIAASHQRLFDSWLKGTRLTGQIERLQFLSSDVALLQTTGGTIFPGQRDARAWRPSIQTLVAVKRDGVWRFTTFQNCRIVHRNAFQWMLYGLSSWLFDR